MNRIPAPGERVAEHLSSGRIQVGRVVELTPITPDHTILHVLIPRPEGPAWEHAVRMESPFVGSLEIVHVPRPGPGPPARHA